MLVDVDNARKCDADELLGHMRRELQEQNISSDKIASFFCPMGLSLGNNTPAEISIGVIAQLLQRRDELGILKHKVKQF